MKRILLLVSFLAFALTACGGGSSLRGSRPHSNGLPVLVSSSTFTGSGAFPQFQTPVATDTTNAGVWQQGDLVSTTNGSWSHNPTLFSYQWQDCDALGGSCSNVSNATSNTYGLTAPDVGGTVRVVVTAYNAFGSASAASAVSGIVASSCTGGGFFGNQGVGGTANGGMGADFKRVTSATASVTGQLTKVTMYLSPTGTAGTQTLRNVLYDNSAGNPNAFLGISDQISFSQSNAAGSYDLTLPDSVLVTSGSTYWIGMITGPTDNVIQFNYDSVGSTTTWELNADTYADGPTDPFGASSNSQPWKMSVYATIASSTAAANTVRPTLSGTASVGSSLSTTNGTWSPAATSFSYQWQDCDSSGINCQYIGGATASSYTVATGDVGHTIRSVVLATNACGSVSRTSAVSGVVAGSAPGNTALPSISGTTTQGQTLSISNGTWTGSPTSYTYQWRDCDSGGASCANATGTGNFCSNGGTGCNYVLTANDVAHTMRVIVTATNASGSTPATSPQSALVVGTTAPINTALPVISGTTTVGSTLSTTNGTWTSGGSAATCGGGVITCAYQWQRCSPGCSNIGSATATSYTLVSADLGDTIDVVVTATNGSGSTPATSAQTATITSSGGSGAPSYSPPSCTQTTTTANYVADITNAAGGAVVCLSAGTYAGHEWISLNKSSRVTVLPSPGATVHLGNVKLTGATNLTWEGFSSLNGSSDSDGLTLQGQFAGFDTNITWEFNSSATAGVSVNTNPTSNANILVTNNKFVGFTASGEQDRILINAQNDPSCPTGITISYNLLANGESDGTDIDGNSCGVSIFHNVYSNINTANCNGIHCDPIQDNGGGSREDIEGNWFHGDSTGLLFDDGNGPGAVTYKNNVCDNPGTSQGCTQGQYADTSVFSHNTVKGEFNFADLSQRGGSVGNPGSTNLTFSNNVMGDSSNSDITYFPAVTCCSYALRDYNVHVTGAYGGSFGNGAHDQIGVPTYVGGASPSTWAGWALTSGSLGHLAASDGKDMGADISSVPGPSW